MKFNAKKQISALLALVLFVGKAHTPAANGKIFIKSK